MCPYGEADVIIVLICERCGTAREASPTEFSSAIEAAAHAAAFAPKSRVIEITGICTNCQREKDGSQTI
jgi:Fur family zinc uptake transcriptional regulator